MHKAPPMHLFIDLLLVLIFVYLCILSEALDHIENGQETPTSMPTLSPAIIIPETEV